MKEIEKFKEKHPLICYMIFGMVALTGGLLVAGSPIILAVIFNAPQLLLLYFPLLGACAGAIVWAEEYH